MANFQLFLQSGRAQDLSAPLYICGIISCDYEIFFLNLRLPITESSEEISLSQRINDRNMVEREIISCLVLTSVYVVW